MHYSIASETHYELVVKKSRFLCYLIPCSDKSRAKEVIECYKQRFSDARHVCSAFSCGGYTGLDDDGEPSGTAAKPMFQVLQMQGIEQVLAIVVRYFGGIKLGAGGLARAYGGAVSECVKLAEKCPVITFDKLNFVVPFSLENKIRYFCQQSELNILQVSYEQTNKVKFSIEIQLVDVDAHRLTLESLALGQILWVDMV